MTHPREERRVRVYLEGYMKISGGTEWVGTNLVSILQICVTILPSTIIYVPYLQTISEKSLMQASSPFIKMKLVWLKKRTSYKKKVEMLRQETQVYLLLQTRSFKMDPLFILLSVVSGSQITLSVLWDRWGEPSSQIMVGMDGKYRSLD